MIKTRIAPSPTGYLHLGTARTALFNWLFAKKYDGEFILRIEDTDLERSDKKYEKDIVEGLKWLGLNWDGEIYHTTKRLDLHKKYLKNLLDSGKAFWCHHTKEELEAEGRDQVSKKEAPRHLCDQKDKNLGEKNGAIIRLRVNTDSKAKRTFKDLVRGEIGWSENLLGDISLAKNLDMPLYNFYVVADDIDMKISHVIRGEDHISNTPKQILIYEALEEKLPEFAHLPLILAPDRSKLSKRHGATSVDDFKKDYLPEAMINFMGFLGYTYSNEILTKEEMAEEFELSKVHKSGAVFDMKKLNWINSQYIRKLGISEFRNLAGIEEIPENALPLITERLEKLSDVQNFSYFWDEPKYDKELLKWKKSTLEKSLETLAEVKTILENFNFANGKDELRKVLDELAKRIGDPVKSPDGDHGASRGLVYWPLRVALTGKEKSPDPVDITYIFGKEKTLERVGMAIDKI